jgi:hypothetical protein
MQNLVSVGSHPPKSGGGGEVKYEINGSTIRIIGSRGVDLVIYAQEDKNFDRFSFGLCFNSMEHGCLPSVEVSGDKRIVITNNLEKGARLYR